MAVAPAPYPARLDARLDEPLNRWLSLIKWLLITPHVVARLDLSARAGPAAPRFSATKSAVEKCRPSGHTTNEGVRGTHGPIGDLPAHRVLRAGPFRPENRRANCFEVPARGHEAVLPARSSAFAPAKNSRMTLHDAPTLSVR
jgi:hypothetical protein